MVSKTKSPTHAVYQLKITLEDSKPPIWRRVQVASNIKLPKLHKVIQEVMGWENYHLHQFIIKKELYGVPYDDDFFVESKMQDEKKFTLDMLITEAKSKFTYEYDFGDGWEHNIVLEKISTPDPSIIYPICLAGARACPPEDCGGIYGYEDMMETLKSDDQEKEELLGWLGGDFDSELFDIDRINWRLKKIK